MATGTTAVPLQGALPQISIQSISLDQSSYKSGDTVTGNITFLNSNSTNEPNIYYDVSLAGNYSNDPSSYHIPAVIYDTTTFGPVFIKEGQTTAPFSYVLPVSVAGKNLGIHIQAHLAEGVPLGWNDAFLSVSGGKPFLSISQASLFADGQNYITEAGPTLYSTSSAQMDLTVSNPSNTSI